MEMPCSNLQVLVDEYKEGVEDDFRILAWKTGWMMVPFTNITEMMEEVGVAGPGSSRDELSLGHIAFHMAGKMSSK